MSSSSTSPIEELTPRQVAQSLSAREILLVEVREQDEYTISST